MTMFLEGELRQAYETTDPRISVTLDEDDKTYLGGTMHPERRPPSGRIIDEQRMLNQIGITD